MRNFLITGAAGFIGYHLCQALLQRGDIVVGFDNMNAYYDVSLKESRLGLLRKKTAFTFVKGDIENQELLDSILGKGRFHAVIHLAAQAGVRYSLECPEAYISSNLTGFFNVLEAAKRHKIPHILYASSSSVYGANQSYPFTLSDKTDTPLSLYAATKKANELMAHSYSHMFDMRLTGFRFFTAYGPYGRPDMALFLFTKAILSGGPIQVFNNGEMWRDFTYVSDIVGGIIALIDKSHALTMDANSSAVYNLGCGKSEKLTDMIRILENELGKKAIVNFLPMQKGDVVKTSADVSALEADTGFIPKVSLEEGVGMFVSWYKEFYGITG